MAGLPTATQLPLLWERVYAHSQCLRQPCPGAHLARGSWVPGLPAFRTSISGTLGLALHCLSSMSQAVGRACPPRLST